jgi:hypothetical protein
LRSTCGIEVDQTMRQVDLICPELQDGAWSCSCPKRKHQPQVKVIGRGGVEQRCNISQGQYLPARLHSLQQRHRGNGGDLS